jgi:hypothetical protein
MISAAFPYQKQRRRVLGSEMAYEEVGEGCQPQCQLPRSKSKPFCLASYVSDDTFRKTAENRWRLA